MLNGAAISWHSKKQRTTALSAVEAEYIALASTCQEAAWLENLVQEVELDHEKCASNGIAINCDNTGTISLSKNHNSGQRTKHIDIRHHFVREMQEVGIINVKYISTDEMIADIH